MNLDFLTPLLFYVFGALAFASAAFMVLQRNPTYSAFSFIVTLVSLSAIYGLLGSPFIAVLQIVVYAGAIMVLFLFVLMLLNVRSESQIEDRGPMRMAAAALAGVFLVQVASVFLRSHVRRTPDSFGAAAVARELFAPRFVYVFEATSILILAALVGAIVLAGRGEGDAR
jgi:NADH-quinone oxidoreductase subunit J